MSRPSEYTRETADRICERIAAGESVRAITADDEMPGERTIYQWLEAHAEFAQQYARARERQADLYAAEIVEIADDGRRDYVKGEDGLEVPDYDHIQRSRLRVDARKWAASKLAPKKYGESMSMKVSDPDGGPVAHKVTIEVVESPRSLAAPVAQLAIEGQVTPEED